MTGQLQAPLLLGRATNDALHQEEDKTAKKIRSQTDVDDSVLEWSDEQRAWLQPDIDHTHHVGQCVVRSVSIV